MSYSKRSRYSRSPSPYKRYSRSVLRSLSRSLSRSRSRSYDSTDVENPGNNLYVTGLSPRITKRDLEKHFSTEGKVEDVHLVADPWTRGSRGFGFVTMCTVEDASRCIKYLNRSVLEGRVITVEKARRRRGRTPTPGRYLGLRTIRVRRRSPSYSPYYRGHSPRYSSEFDRSRSRSPYYRRRRSYSPCYNRRGSYSPYYSQGSRYPYSRSPVSRRDGSYSPYYNRHYSPDDRHYRRGRYRSLSRSTSPVVRRSLRRSYSGSVSPRRSYRSYSRSVSPGRLRSYSRSISPRQGSSRRSYTRSISPRIRSSSRRSYSRSISPRQRSSRRSYTRSISPRIRSSSRRSIYRNSSRRHEYSRGSYSSRSPSGSLSSRSVTPSSSH